MEDETIACGQEGASRGFMIGLLLSMPTTEQVLGATKAQAGLL